MIINPFPMLGWNSTFKGDIKHVAMAVDVATVGAHRTSNLHYRVSSGGLRWYAVPLKGDLAGYTKSDGGPGAFQPHGILRFKGAWYVHGTIWKAASDNEGGLFRSEDGRTWDRVTTGFDTAGTVVGFGGQYEDAAANASHMLLTKPYGGIVYTGDGVSFAQRTDLVGYSGEGGLAIVRPRVAATSAGVVVSGADATASGNKIKTATTPDGVFTDRGAPMGAKSRSIFEQGNIVLAISIYNPAIDPQRSVYAMADDLSVWADAGFTATTGADRAFYALGMWHVGAGANWLRSEGASGIPGVGGWEAATVPWAAAGVIVNVGYEHEARAFVHFGNGQVAFSDDGEAFTVVANANLATKPYFACAA